MTKKEYPKRQIFKTRRQKSAVFLGIWQNSFFLISVLSGAGFLFIANLSHDVFLRLVISTIGGLGLWVMDTRARIRRIAWHDLAAARDRRRQRRRASRARIEAAYKTRIDQYQKQTHQSPP